MTDFFDMRRIATIRLNLSERLAVMTSDYADAVHLALFGDINAIKRDQKRASYRLDLCEVRALSTALERGDATSIRAAWGEVFVLSRPATTGLLLLFVTCGKIERAAYLTQKKCKRLLRALDRARASASDSSLLSESIERLRSTST
ncbi:hypothetical protein AKJ09_08321 [Labilithrix luteola]|uniref:Uncharacterized protein n=1 Tax=Labilithrix luteola TaxID=1391654 RepID=A0A0K1Q7D5_9BACT|nr:hypothetical protein [Labilithrix luteola]AKV01658.1 hypothetical protein AKJ09_08321 [Labilithrix luteola]